MEGVSMGRAARFLRDATLLMTRCRQDAGATSWGVTFGIAPDFQPPDDQGRARDLRQLGRCTFTA